MSGMLTDLFFGKVAPFENITEKTSGTQELFRKYVGIRDEFEKTLSDEQRKGLDDLITTRMDLETAYAEAAFREGFRIAVGLLADAIGRLPES